MLKIVRTYTVIVVEDPYDTDSPAENLRDCLLDSWGFPKQFHDNPEQLIVKLEKEEPHVEQA